VSRPRGDDGALPLLAARRSSIARPIRATAANRRFHDAARAALDDALRLNLAHVDTLAVVTNVFHDTATRRLRLSGRLHARAAW
jgi:hypothetical protein